MAAAVAASLNRFSADTESRAEIRVRPQAQAVFCIDVRSEPLRRNLEATGDYETLGFAGFFAVSIRYQALGSHHETDQFPVIMKSKNLVREIPRTYQGQFLFSRVVEKSFSKLDTRCSTISRKMFLRPTSWSNRSAGFIACRCSAKPFSLPAIETSWTGFGANSFRPWRRL